MKKEYKAYGIHEYGFWENSSVDEHSKDFFMVDKDFILHCQRLLKSGAEPNILLLKTYIKRIYVNE